MKFEDIRAEIIRRMQSFTGVAQNRIDYKIADKRFSPPSSGVWCRPTVQFSPSFMAGMADKPYTRKPGLIVIQCFSPEREPEAPLLRLADSLEDHFAYWSEGHLECLEVSLIYAGIGSTIANPTGTGYQQINVRVPFRAG